MGGNKNNASDIYSLIWKELNQICLCHKEDTIISYNRLCSILKVISRPFVSYRHSVLKASTKILLEIFDYFVFDSKQNIISKKNIACKMFFDSIINNTILHEDFILLIMSCLTELNSTILMVTHDSFTASYCDRILFIKDGKIFTELVRGTNTRRQFFNKILDVVALLGGDVRDVR